jgi:hypothetical protein
MVRVQIVDKRTHLVLLEGECSLPAGDLRHLMFRHDLTAIDASHVAGQVVIDATGPARPAAAAGPPPAAGDDDDGDHGEAEPAGGGGRQAAPGRRRGGRR